MPLELAGAEQAALDRRVRAADFLTDMIAEHKTRIRELARQVMPTVGQVFTNKFGKADLAVLEHFGDPRKLLALGQEALTAFIANESNGLHGASGPRRGCWPPPKPSSSMATTLRCPMTTSLPSSPPRPGCSGS